MRCCFAQLAQHPLDAHPQGPKQDTDTSVHSCRRRHLPLSNGSSRHVPHVQLDMASPHQYAAQPAAPCRTTCNAQKHPCMQLILMHSSPLWALLVCLLRSCSIVEIMLSLPSPCLRNIFCCGRPSSPHVAVTAERHGGHLNDSCRAMRQVQVDGLRQGGAGQ